MPSRLVVVVSGAVLIAAGALWFLRDEQRSPFSGGMTFRGAMTQEEMARAVGGPVTLNLARGHVPGRSGEIMLVPKPHNFMINEWDLRTLDADAPEIKTTHPGPWSYLTRIPIVVRGPGVPAGEEIGRPVDITSIAPTYAALLGMSDFSSTSEPLPEILPSAPDPLKAIVTVVIDGGGWNLLERYGDAWPNIRRLMEQGVTYRGATLGSAPSTTGALHATFGTGFYPKDHGIPGNVLRDDDGEIVDVFYGKDSDLRHLRVPTVSELWDERNENEAVVATVSIENWHLGMIGKGALRETGDRDLAAFWDREKERWIVNEEYFELPRALRSTDLGRLELLESKLDARDGAVGDGWFGNDLQDIVADKSERPSTPAMTRLMGDGVVSVLSQEGVGDDDITDLVWIEIKMPDSAGHAWNMVGPEVEDVLKQTDAEIGRFVDVLDRRLGRAGYLFLVTADHGQQPLPDDTGGWRINSSELERDIVARFGPVVDNATPADLYLDAEGLGSAGATPEDIAAWLSTYTLEQNLPDDAPGRHLVPEDRLDETLYAAAFTSDFLADLRVDPRALGFGDYGSHGRFPVIFTTDR